MSWTAVDVSWTAVDEYRTVDDEGSVCFPVVN
jgi:hypothetical protein